MMYSNEKKSISIKNTVIIILCLICNSLNAQESMRPLTALINTEDSAWPLIQEWIQSAKNKVEVIPAEAEYGREALYNTQVTTYSPMGAIVFHTSGILIDNGWIRILGAGNSKRYHRSLPAWNKGKTGTAYGEQPGYLIIADDAVGGFFLLNGGALGEDVGKVYYWAPDNLNIEPLELSYTDFLHFCFYGNLNEFYSNLRWNNWQEEVSKISADEVFSFFPFLFTSEGKDINAISRKVIPIEEYYNFMLQQVK